MEEHRHNSVALIVLGQHKRIRVLWWSILAILISHPTAAALGSSEQWSYQESPPPQRSTSDWADLSGWYEFSDRRRAMLTWGADGGLRLAQLRKPFFSQAFRPQDDGTWIWETDSETATRTVRFRFTHDGQAHGYAWSDEQGGSGSARRIQPQPYRLTEISYRNGEVMLSGTLLLPGGEQPLPSAVMIHGSGSSNRDNLWYLAIADHLARSGVAVLLPDKRGCGKSGGDWKTSSMNDFARDTRAAVEAVGRFQEIDPKHIGLLGISQGGRIAPLAATQMSSIAFVINVSGGALPVDLSLLHESRQTLRQKGLPGWIADGFGPLAAAIAKRRHPIWWKKNGDFDPMPYWQKLRVPGLVVYGADDEQDNVPVIRSVELLEGIDPAVDLTIHVYPESGHGLFLPGTQTIRPEFLNLLAQWIHDKTGANESSPVRQP